MTYGLGVQRLLVLTAAMGTPDMRFRASFPAIVLLTTALGAGSAQTDDNHASRATYLGNAGVMVEHGDTKVVFDPLFRNDYDRYERVPEDIESALFAGEASFHGIDAIFISHYHGDHFSPEVMLSFLEARTDIELYAPAQAVTALVEAGASDTVMARVNAVNLVYGDAPIKMNSGDLIIEAVRIPHSGWPESMTDIENIAWRVTLDGETSVVHLGDADTKALHFDLHEDHWKGVATDLALPPYWYFLSPNGRTVLDTRIDEKLAVGVHVPASMPDDPESRPAEIQGFDLFTRPGEIRDLESAEPAKDY